MQQINDSLNTSPVPLFIVLCTVGISCLCDFSMKQVTNVSIQLFGHNKQSLKQLCGAAKD